MLLCQRLGCTERQLLADYSAEFIDVLVAMGAAEAQVERLRAME